MLRTHAPLFPQDHPKNHYRPKARPYVLWWSLLLLALDASAADVEVKVVSKTSGEPLTGAAVCLGTTADSDQFGALLTGPDGRASFSEVPHTRLVLTASKSGFLGYQALRSAGDYDRVIVVSLAKGGLGPVCHTAQPAPQTVAASTSLHIGSLRVNDGSAETTNRSVALSAVVSGKPTHYRASEDPEFRDADWQPFAASARFLLSPSPGKKTVYYQVRRYREVNGASVQSVSNTAAATVSLR